MNPYQIKDWNLHFENDRSRQRAQCSFVCVPNKQHGMGFCRIMAEPDGAAIYGIWHCIVGACSQQKKRNGWLTSDGEQEGSPWGVDDLALKFRRPTKEIERALQVLTSEKVGWIIPSTNSVVTTDSPPTHLEGKGKKEGKEGKGSGASLPSADIQKVFDQWNSTAEKSGLPKCLLISDKRRRSLQVRLNEQFFRENWEVGLKRISTSLFCRGQNNRGWKADFDWFISPDVVAKVIEGKYDSGKPSTPNGSPTPVQLTNDELLRQSL